MKRKKKKKYQHSKLMFNVLLINGILWVWACFFLAYFDKPQIAESLAIASVTTVLGSFVTLCTKSYKETKQEKIQELNDLMYRESRGLYGNEEKEDA